jgi:RHS repeat-associated protein
MPDALGNLFQSPERNDRVYGPGGRLLEAHTQRGLVRYQYDFDGNLIRKELLEKEGRSRVWTYEWNEGGQLECVVRPDGDPVKFAYDPLGRRIRKETKIRTTHWIWDGDVPLHEWAVDHKPFFIINKSTNQIPTPANAEGVLDALFDGRPSHAPPHAPSTDGMGAGTLGSLRVGVQAPERWEFGTKEEPITWVFDPETFSPAAKWVGNRKFSILTDVIGTPYVMLDSGGKEVWSADVNVYGQRAGGIGSEQSCPFRFPGQYHDEETGLSYNRFRYYDPESGLFISEDPIRLSGGPILYGYPLDVNSWIDPLGLSTGEDYDHITYRGTKGGKPYTGYASAPSSQGLTGDQILARRYSGNYAGEGLDGKPEVIYEGSGVEGKQTARGLEQHHYETDLKAAGGDTTKVANKQRPVGPNNKNAANYKKKANAHLASKCP